MTAAPSPLGPPMHHVFMDFENVHHVDLSLIGAGLVSFTLLVGPQQTKLDSALVEKLMEHSASVRLVKLKSRGRNALDFALAYYVGRAALADPTGHFHIVSKDAGYDPLIEHLRDRHLDVQRHAGCADLPFPWPGKAPAANDTVVRKTAPKKAASKKVAAKTAAKKAPANPPPAMESVENWTDRVLKNLTDHPKARPKKRPALCAKIANLIKKPADSPEVASVIDRLTSSKVLSFDDKGIANYQLPDSAGGN